MEDKLISTGLAEFDKVGTAQGAAIQFDLSDPEQRVAVAFGGLAFSAIRVRAPLEALCDETASGNGVFFSLSTITGPKLTAPIAKEGEQILRGVHWHVEDTSVMKGDAFNVLRTETVQQVGPVYRKGNPGAVGQVVRHVEQQRDMTPDQMIADFRAVSKKLLPKKYHAKLGLHSE